jgi:hypothetical protein
MLIHTAATSAHTCCMSLHVCTPQVEVRDTSGFPVREFFEGGHFEVWIFGPLLDTEGPTAVSAVTASLQLPTSDPSVIHGNCFHRALIIGISGYLEEESFPNLDFAATDAHDMSSLLCRLGYKVSLALNVSKERLGAAVEKFTSELEPGCTAVFFFSGHGVSCGGRNFLVPVDGNASSIESSCVSLDDDVLNRVSDAVVNGALVALLDCCRSSSGLSHVQPTARRPRNR